MVVKHIFCFCKCQSEKHSVKVQSLSNMSMDYLIFIDDSQFQNIYKKSFPINEQIRGSIGWLTGINDETNENHFQFVGRFAEKIQNWKTDWNKWKELVDGIDEAILKGFDEWCIIRALKTAKTTVCFTFIFIFLYIFTNIIGTKRMI